MARTRGLLPVPATSAERRAELQRLDLALALVPHGPGRRVLAMERRRVLVAEYG